MTVYVVCLPSPHNAAMVLICCAYAERAAAEAHAAKYNQVAVERGHQPDYEVREVELRASFFK